MSLRSSKTSQQRLHTSLNTHRQPQESRRQLTQSLPVIHVCHSYETASTEIPLLLQGKPLPNPDSALSTFHPSASHTNNFSAQQIPKAIVLGKGFSNSEVASLHKTISSQEPTGNKTVWLVPDDDKFSLGMKVKAMASAGVLLPGMIAERVKASLRDEVGLVKGKQLGEVEGGMFGF